MSSPASPAVKTVEVADGNAGVPSGAAPAPKLESATGGSDAGDFVEVKSPVQPPAVPYNGTEETVVGQAEPVREVDDTPTRSANDEDQKAHKAATVENDTEDQDATQARPEEDTYPPEVGNSSAQEQEGQEKKTAKGKGKAKKATATGGTKLPKWAKMPHARPQGDHGHSENDDGRLFARDPYSGELVEIEGLLDQDGQRANFTVVQENGRKVLKPVQNPGLFLMEIPALFAVDQMMMENPAGFSSEGPYDSDRGSSHVSPRTANPPQAPTAQRTGGLGIHTDPSPHPRFPDTQPRVPGAKQVEFDEQPTVLGGPYPPPPGRPDNASREPGYGSSNPARGPSRPREAVRAPPMPQVYRGPNGPAPAPTSMGNPHLPPLPTSTPNPPPPPQAPNNWSHHPHGRPFLAEPGRPPMNPVLASPAPPVFKRDMFGPPKDKYSPYAPMPQPAVHSNALISDQLYFVTNAQHQQRVLMEKMLEQLSYSNRAMTKMADQLVSQNRDTQDLLWKTQRMLLGMPPQDMGRYNEPSTGGVHNYTVQNMHQYNASAPRSGGATGGFDNSWDFPEFAAPRELGDTRGLRPRPNRTAGTFHYCPDY